MSQSSSEIAECASFQAFINSYLREIDEGISFSAQQWALRCPALEHFCGTQVIELTLTSQKIKLALDIKYRSLVGRHHVASVAILQANDSWRAIDFFPALIFVVNEIYANAGQSLATSKEKQIEFMLRLIDSHQVMARYLDARKDDPRLMGDRFIESEQSLLFGHWLHPTPKSRQGMADWLHDPYAPELCGKFTLHYFAVKRDYIKQDYIQHDSDQELHAELVSRHILGESADELQLADDDVIVPAHPLQAQWLIHQDFIQQAVRQGIIRDLGRRGLEFTATSSVRTVYSPQLDWMLKFSIPVKITNSLRLNHYAELVAGSVMASLLHKCGFTKKYPQFKTINDPAYISVQLPAREESGFELIIRNNPFIEQCDKGVHSLAALMQDPLPGHKTRLTTLIETLSLVEGRSLAQISLDWFDCYCDCALVPLILLYEEQGIALEAHQQNSLLDVTKGYPSSYYYRDNQGFYLSPAHRHSLIAIEPDVARSPELFYDDAMICDRFSYYLIINQLYSVIHRFGADGLIAEEILLERVRQRFQLLEKQLHGTGKVFVRGLLEKATIPCKANLLTRLHDIDELTAELELAVYTRIKNPLAMAHQQRALEVNYEVA
jgi:siderophore synthetase component